MIMSTTSKNKTSLENIIALLPQMSYQEKTELIQTIIHEHNNKHAQKLSAGDNAESKEPDRENESGISVFFIDELFDASSDARHMINMVAEAAEYAKLAGEAVDRRSTHRTLVHALKLLMEADNKTKDLWEEYRLLSSPNTTPMSPNDKNLHNNDHHWLA